MTDKRDSSLPRCSNSNAGTFNHECGKPASWAGKHRSKLNPGGFHVQYFCDHCRAHGDEARHVIEWTRVQSSPITEIDDGMGGTYRPGFIIAL